MSLLKLACTILALASIASASIGPHYDFAPQLQFAGPPLGYAPQPILPPQFIPQQILQPAILPPPVLPPPVIPAPILPPPILPAPVYHAAPAPFWPAPAPISYYPAPAPAPLIPAPLPLPLPLTRPLPPLLEALPFAPAYRAIPGPITKTHHVSVGLAYPVPAKVIAAPAPHVHPVKLIAQPSHAHIHAHSAPLISHHHHVIA